jgi:dTDP-4-dehydrorhamnose 3,5-epimerase
MNRFELLETPLSGLNIIQRKASSDDRGFLSRLFCSEELSRVGWNRPIAQINHSFTRQQGALRGMHYQMLPHTEKKLVSCVRGSVWDVAVDLRKGSSSFLQWFGQELSADNQTALLIPEGFAHGFQVLSDGGAELIYLHSAHYSSSHEAAVSALDPKIGISWPLAISDLSYRDRSHDLITEDFLGVDCE